MTPKSSMIGAWLMALMASLPAEWAVAEATGSNTIEDDIRYLLVFRALPPHQKKERNFYELAREIKGFIDARFFPPTAVITDEEIRYNVLKIIKTKVLKTTRSNRSPRASNKSRYVLAYNSLYKLCAIDYRIDLKNSNGGAIHYTDCESGQQHDFPIQTRRPFEILEIELLTENVLRSVWEAKHQSSKN